MDSVGRFHMKEVDVKANLVYSQVTFSNQPATDSGDSPVSQTLFLCPRARIESAIGESSVPWEGHMKYEYATLLRGPLSLELASYPAFHGVAQQIESLDDYERLDPFDHHVLPLFWCEQEDRSETCYACFGYSKISSDFYFCGKCDERYHKKCVESPPRINHPLHPKHPLQLYFDMYVMCFHCKKKADKIVYYCSLCKFSMHPICAAEPVTYVVEQCKRHEHPLTFFTRPASLDCNVCGLISDVHPTYVCIQCNFVAHRDCVDSPHVIRISRHHHRVSFTPSLPPGNKSCGVCRKEIDRKYGGYTCHTCDDYVVHSRCALRKDVWDGEELAGVPEEEEIVEPPFERISEGVILHFTHTKHLLRLETSRVYEESKICDACVSPIYEGDFYSCGECDFLLHDTCANAPRRKRHPLHPHPLTLAFVNGNRSDGSFNCFACHCLGSGFIYECKTKGCRFKLDLRCASISEPYDYPGHTHPLFLALDPAEETKWCQVCKSSDEDRSELSFKNSLLNCIECDYIICIECVNLPYMARYKHDTHFLTLVYGDKTSKQDWCEVCEKQLPSSRRDKRFYTCNHCCTTLHKECLLGKDRYFKHGHTVTSLSSTRAAAKILLNNSLSRPTCYYCMRRCEYRIIFRLDNKTWCSFQHFSSSF